MQRSLAFLLFMALVVPACGGETSPDPAAPSRARPLVMTTFHPTTWMAERLAGDAADVVCPVPPDEDPIFWQPDEETIAQYQSADLIVVNGAGLEKWVEVTSLPDARVVDTARGFADRFLQYEHAVEHSHGPGGAHAHAGLDGHTWMDPSLAKLQAGEIARALKRLLPEPEPEAVDRRLAEVEADLDAVHQRLVRATDAYDGWAIYASHPAYNYPARAYGWEIVNLDLDPEEMPDEETIAGIRSMLEDRPARFLLWEGEPTEQIAGRIRSELGLESLVVSPCEVVSAEDRAAGEDFLVVLGRNAEALEKALSTAP